MGVETIIVIGLACIVLLFAAVDFLTNGSLISLALKIYREKRYGKLSVRIQDEILDQLQSGPRHPVDLIITNPLFIEYADDYQRALQDLIASGKVVYYSPSEKAVILYYALPEV